MKEASKNRTVIDRDLLITINVQLENLIRDFKEFKSEQQERIIRLETTQGVTNEQFGTRIRSLEDGRIWLTGWAAGAGAAGAFIFTRFIK